MTMLALAQNANSKTDFAKAHEKVPDLIVDLENVALATLQKYVDTTFSNRRQYDFTGRNGDRALSALEKAASSGAPTCTVLWNIHQHQTRPLKAAGKCKHFTVRVPGEQTDLHFYVNTDGSRISYISFDADTYYQIKKF
ncbi:hypothetical protein [Azospirillum brasilense]|uniref:hypothetical protein n=1 Tax=Azospirillum brasilense TaxID=192 RepID=UPI00190CFB7B|nr:hypothetical protein [Azospirillum brasilense]